MAFHRSPAAPGEESEALVEARGDLVGTHHSGAGGRELDRERYSVQPPADLGDRGRSVGVEHEITARLLGAFHEELHCVCGDDLCGRRPLVGQRKRPHHHHPLAAHSEPFAPGREHTDAGARRQKSCDQLRSGVEEVLAVVEHDQELLANGEWRGDSRSSTARVAAARQRPRPRRPAVLRVSLSGASSQSHAPSGYSGRTRPRSARRDGVLPTPPTPINVTTRAGRSASTTSSTSSSRPTKASSWSGRFVGNASQTNATGKVRLEIRDARTWNTRSGSPRSRSRCSPRSTSSSSCRARAHRWRATPRPGRRDRQP